MLLESFIHHLARYCNHNPDCVAELEEDRNEIERRLLKIERDLLDARTTISDLATKLTTNAVALRALAASKIE